MSSMRLLRLCFGSHSLNCCCKLTGLSVVVYFGAICQAPNYPNSWLKELAKKEENMEYSDSEDDPEHCSGFRTRTSYDKDDSLGTETADDFFRGKGGGILRMVHQGPRPLVICGPSGSGKSTLLQRLFAEFPTTFGFSVSHTTRNPRPGEEDGKHYHFTTREAMTAAIARGEFLETAEFSKNMYGTSKAAVQAVLREGKICVLDIEVQGVKQVKETDLNPMYVFIKPPSLEELERRLRERGTETEESLKRRLDTAKVELEYGEAEGNFDLVLENSILDKAYIQLRQFVLAELGKEKVAGASSE